MSRRSLDLSDSDSGSEAEFGPAGAGASARTPRTLLAAELEKLNLSRMIDEPSWQTTDQSNFHERTVVAHYRLSGGQKFPNPSHRPPSSTSSMAVSVQAPRSLFESSVASSQVSISYAPSLQSTGTTQSAPSIRTSEARSVLKQRVLEEDEDGVPVVPMLPEGRLRCSFPFIKDCVKSFDDFEEWDTHNKAHLRGQPPKAVTCPFRCDWRKRADSGEEAWERRRLHMMRNHADEATVPHRPEEPVLRCLLALGVINRAEFKDLMGPGGSISGDTYTSPSGPLRDSRRERQERRPARR